MAEWMDEHYEGGEDYVVFKGLKNFTSGGIKKDKVKFSNIEDLHIDSFKSFKSVEIENVGRLRIMEQTTTGLRRLSLKNISSFECQKMHLREVDFCEINNVAFEDEIDISITGSDVSNFLSLLNPTKKKLILSFLFLKFYLIDSKNLTFKSFSAVVDNVLFTGKSH